MSDKQTNKPKRYIPPHHRQNFNSSTAMTESFDTNPNPYNDQYNNNTYNDYYNNKTDHSYSKYNNRHSHQTYQSNRTYNNNNNNTHYKPHQHRQSNQYSHSQSQSHSRNSNYYQNHGHNYQNKQNRNKRLSPSHSHKPQSINKNEPNFTQNNIPFLTENIFDSLTNENDDSKSNDLNISNIAQEPAIATHSKPKDKLFEEYLIKYKIEHKKKYIAPFQIRRLKKEYESMIKEQKKEAKQKQTEKQTENIENDENDGTGTGTGTEERINHFPFEYSFFRNFYLENSAYYSEWQDMRHDGWNNKHLEKFFDLKHKNQDNVSRSSDKNIINLFNRFYRYAIDINNVCNYKNDLLKQLMINNNEKVFFFDIGFAPGGMSRLLLDASPNIYGLGVTLPPYEAGNTFINELLYDNRFLCREYDIVLLCKKIHNRSDFLSLMTSDYSHQNISDNNHHWFDNFLGFNLGIIGITCHQDFNSNERLDHQILLSELYITFLTLCDGGSVLIRHKIALDCIHQHILYIFLQCFNEYNVGKPMTEFAIRKTFWILWKGFDRKKCKKLKLLYYLRKLIHEYDGNKPPYAKDPNTNEYYNPKMISKTPNQIINELTNHNKTNEIINVMDPVFKIQMISLKSFCSGKKDRLCIKGQYCKQNNCNRAHCENDCIDGFYDALINVNNVLNKQIQLNKNHSKILNLLHKQLNRQKQKYSNKNVNNTNTTNTNTNTNNNWRGNR